MIDMPSHAGDIAAQDRHGPGAEGGVWAAGEGQEFQERGRLVVQAIFQYLRRDKHVIPPQREALVAGDGARCISCFSLLLGRGGGGGYGAWKLLQYLGELCLRHRRRTHLLKDAPDRLHCKVHGHNGLVRVHDDQAPRTQNATSTYAGWKK
jgi:hypothetical protein